MDEEMLVYCRCCYALMAGDKKQSKLSEAVKKFKNVTIGKMLIECTGVVLKTQDMEENVICGECKYHLYSFYKFRLKVHQTTLLFNEVKLETPELKMEVKVEPYLVQETTTETIATTFIEEAKYSDDDMRDNYDLVIERYDEVDEAEEEEVEEEAPKPKPRFKKPKKLTYTPLDRLNPLREKVRVERMPRRKESLKLYKRNDKGLFECPKCPTTFSFLGRLELHLDIEHGYEGQTSFPCSHCDQVFTFFKELKYHVDLVHTPRPYTCDLCGKTTVTYNSMKGHIMRMHLGIGKGTHGRPATCTICGKTLATNDILSKHMRYKHMNRDLPKPYECSVCGSKWKDKSTLNKHLQIHFNTTEYECDRCGKKLSSKYGLAAHISYVHDSDRSWSCEICGKSFKGKHTLQNHRVTHTDTKPFKCDQCDATFKSSNSVRTHKRLMHLPQPEAECEICHKVFKNAYTVRSHMLLHTNPDLPCDICGKTYKVRDSLNRHIRAFHKGIKKRHRCKLCAHHLWSRKHIEEHVEQMHKEYLVNSGSKARDFVERYLTNETHEEEPPEPRMK